MLVVVGVVTLALVVLALDRGPTAPPSYVGEPGGAAVAPDPAEPPAAPASDPTSGAAAAPATGPLARVQERLRRGLDATSFPPRATVAAQLGSARWADGVRRDGGCLDVPAGSDDECASGPADSPDTALVLGDDAALSYLPAVRDALDDRFRVRQVTLRGCPVWDAPVVTTGGRPNPACDRFRAWSRAEVARVRPDVLVLATSWQAGALLDMAAIGPASPATAIIEGYRAALADLVPAARITIVLGAPPGGADLAACATGAGATPASCTTTRPTTYDDVVATEDDLVTDEGAVFIDTRDWFCVQARCPALAGAVPVYADGLHVSVPWARSLGPTMRAALAGAADRLREREGG
ncbi:SGNH hydrolase domain-containing protein [Nocardioides litoris]|uniref:SGNH hydrolase domain-containing protein n=1 Tax=Nocardioides litoris TaxID=1926648 RepID=UPI0014778074|nr:SGNH hydrolase domain-containing protein [Nocardioides litoris]